MKRFRYWVLVLALTLPALARCGLPEQLSPAAFDALARRLPGDAEQAFFLDLKPDGEAGRHWERFRRELEATPAAQEVLSTMLAEFKIEEYGLAPVIVGPVANGFRSGGNAFVVAQVSDEAAAADALRQHFPDVAWEQEEYQSRTLYQGQNRDSYRQREWLAWTVYDGLLFLCHAYNQHVLELLKELVSLAEEDSLASLSSWRALRTRLPEDPMGLLFLNIAEQMRRNAPAPGDTSPSVVLGQQVEALAFAAMPEERGMRVQMVGTFAPEADTVPELRSLFDRPAVDAAAWTGLPANTAIALICHDASTVWLWLNDILDFPTGSLDLLRETLGLDLEADLLSADGPLVDHFALAITPPLPDQPISQGLAAAQLLFLARGATRAQVEDVRTAMEGRGATFGSQEVEGVPLQIQVGTAPTGYAISYGFDGDLFLFGSSPGVVAWSGIANREGQGLVETEPFRTVLDTLPDEPVFVAYLNRPSLTETVRANLIEEHYQGSQEFLILEPFEAIGLGLRFQPDRLDGVIYFLIE